MKNVESNSMVIATNLLSVAPIKKKWLNTTHTEEPGMHTAYPFHSELKTLEW